MAADGAHLEVCDLVLERGRRVLVDGLGFAARAGELVQLRGPNGSGKTTVMRALAGLVLPAAGRIAWRGRPLGASTLAAELSFVGHLSGLCAELDARENLGFHSALCAAPRRAGIDEALARLGALRFAARPVGQLSAGQRQRVALARLLLYDTALWMLDEPFTALDADARGVLEALLDTHLDGGGIVVIATHQPFATRHAPITIALGPRAQALAPARP